MRCRTYPDGMWRVLLSVITLAFTTHSLSSCGHETVFPEQPEAHRLFEEVEEWPDGYYFLIAAGVSSRVMGLPSVPALLSTFEEQWANIENLDSAEELIRYFRGHDLTPVAESIETTLSQNRGLEPTGEPHSQLQADAIKRGLLYAFWELKGQSPP